MLTLEYIQKQLKIINIKKAARETGMSYMTFYKIRDGKIANPKYHTLLAIEEYLKQENK